MAPRKVRFASTATAPTCTRASRSKSRAMSTDTGLREINRVPRENQVQNIPEEPVQNILEESGDRRNNDTNQLFSDILSRRPVVLLARLPNENFSTANEQSQGHQPETSVSGESVSDVNRSSGTEDGAYSLSVSDSDAVGASSQSSVSSQANDSPLVSTVYDHFEFLQGVREGSELLYVHDLQQLYRFRYPQSSGRVYECRKANCLATVIITHANVCKLFNTAVHQHPTVEQEYANMRFKSNLKERAATEDFSRRDLTLRRMYDSQRLE